MILGIGVDIIDLRRIDRILKSFGERFIKRILTEYEIQSLVDKAREYEFVGTCFAAKEAVSKALGTGIGALLSWRDIELRHHVSGKPYIKLYRNALKILLEMGGAEDKIHISISHEKEFVIVFVILEKSGG